MLGRDNRQETAMVFAIKEKRLVAEKRTYRHCGRYGHDESELRNYRVASSLGILRPRTLKSQQKECRRQQNNFALRPTNWTRSYECHDSTIQQGKGSRVMP